MRLVRAVIGGCRQSLDTKHAAAWGRGRGVTGPGNLLPILLTAGALLQSRHDQWWQRAGRETKAWSWEWTRWLLCAGWVALGPDVWGHLNSGVTSASVTSVTRDTVWHRVTSGVISSRLTQTLINQQPAASHCCWTTFHLSVCLLCPCAKFLHWLQIFICSN